MRTKWGPDSIRGRLLARQDHKCCYCELPVRVYHKKVKGAHVPDMATLEHLDRRSNGGSNHKDNFAIACFECNSQRGQIDWLSYKTWIMDIQLPIIKMNRGLHA